MIKISDNLLKSPNFSHRASFYCLARHRDQGCHSRLPPFSHSQDRCIFLPRLQGPRNHRDTFSQPSLIGSSFEYCNKCALNLYECFIRNITQRDRSELISSYNDDDALIYCLILNMHVYDLDRQYALYHDHGR